MKTSKYPNITVGEIPLSVNIVHGLSEIVMSCCEGGAHKQMLLVLYMTALTDVTMYSPQKFVFL
jgi:hypothetical protein